MMKIRALSPHLLSSFWIQHCNPIKRPMSLTSTLSNIQNVPSKEQQSTSQNINKMKIDQLMKNIGVILEDKKLQNSIKEEFAIITKFLRSFNESNHSLSEIQKLYEEEESNHFLRGIIVLLVVKGGLQEISETHWKLAKVVEMVNMALLIHKKIHNIGSNHETHVNVDNKVAVLYGDFLWAKAWKELSDMCNMEVIDMMVSVLVNTSEGQFLSEIELSDLNNKLTIDYWLKKNYLLSACLPAFACKSAFTLAKFDLEIQTKFFEFGQNFGFFNKAFNEIKWFINDFSTNESIDFCSLPVITHSMETGKPLTDLVRVNNKKIEFNIQALHEIVHKGPGINRSKKILDNFRNKSLDLLKYLPESEAKYHLKSIFEVMNI